MLPPKVSDCQKTAALCNEIWLMLLWASKFATAKIEYSFKIGKQAPFRVTFILLVRSDGKLESLPDNSKYFHDSSDCNSGKKMRYWGEWEQSWCMGSNLIVSRCPCPSMQQRKVRLYWRYRNVAVSTSEWEAIGKLLHYKKKLRQ